MSNTFAKMAMSRIRAYRAFVVELLLTKTVLDLKAHFRGLKYVAETVKLLPQKPEPIVTQQITAKIALLGAVNAT